MTSINRERKSLLYCFLSLKNHAEKFVCGFFNVTLGGFDEEVHELVGTFLHFHLSKHYNKIDFGLNQCHDLAVLKNTSTYSALYRATIVGENKFQNSIPILKEALKITG